MTLKKPSSQILGNTLDAFDNIASDIRKQVVNAPAEFAKTLQNQLNPLENEGKKLEKKGSNAVTNARQKDNSDLLNAMYEQSSDVGKDVSNGENNSKKWMKKAQILSTSNGNKNNSQEELQKIAQLKAQLHKQSYYDPTFNRSVSQEERVVEKIEREEHEEKAQLLEKKKKKKDLAVDRAEKSTEVYRGAAG